MKRPQKATQRQFSLDSSIYCKLFLVVSLDLQKGIVNDLLIRKPGQHTQKVDFYCYQTRTGLAWGPSSITPAEHNHDAFPPSNGLNILAIKPLGKATPWNLTLSAPQGHGCPQKRNSVFTFPFQVAVVVIIQLWRLTHWKFIGFRGILVGALLGPFVPFLFGVLAQIFVLVTSCITH